MLKTQEKFKTHQGDILDYACWKKKRWQDVCKHSFRRYPMIDHENNRLYNIFVCSKCGLER